MDCKGIPVKPEGNSNTAGLGWGAGSAVEGSGRCFRFKPAELEDREAVPRNLMK